MAAKLLSGNEAIARGAWEAGVSVGVGYPGTPSTETLQNFVRMDGVIAEWAPNEKVALEVAAGVSMGGRRALVTMKHVGVNVAADPLFTLAYTGVSGGLVILVADDPGMHSSQNEQDSRNWGPFARVPILEPSDSAEALRFTKLAFELSERFDIPVIVRSNTRISHSKGLVEVGERVEVEPKPYEKDAAKWVMMPAMARKRRLDLDERVHALSEWAESDEGPDIVHEGSTELGVVVSGVAYQYVREALPEASVYKVSVVFPLAAERLKRFAASVDRIAVVEEADPYLSRSLRAMGIAVEETSLPPDGELSPGKVSSAFGMAVPETREGIEGLPPRPPLMCPGCPHRGAFYALRKARAIVTGDIGCYTLAALQPLAAMDSCVCMGAGIGMAHGMALAGASSEKRPVVGVIGDSTFAHSGVTGLMHMAYNAGVGTIAILDNRITAMTGHQGNPVTGRTLAGRQNRELDLEALCAAMGIEHVTVVDPHDLGDAERVVKQEVARDALSVIIMRAPCALLLKEHDTIFAVNDESCTACGVCIRLGCPAISSAEAGKASIDATLCVGCTQCVQVCKFDAIEAAGPACDIGGV